MDPWILLGAVLLFAFLGSLLGILTGLAPGIHVNNVALLVIAFSGVLGGVVTVLLGWAAPTPGETALLLSTLVVANVMTHIFVDFLPSIFLGAPNPDTALSVLPGHQLLLEGRGYEAVRLAVFGSISSLLVSLVLLVPVRFIMGSPVDAYQRLQDLQVIPLILIFIVAILILTESPNRGPTRPILYVGASKERFSSRPEIPSIPVGLVGSGPEGVVMVRGELRKGFGRHILTDDSGTIEVRFEHPPIHPGPVVLEGLILNARSLWSYIVPRGLAFALFLLAGFLGLLVLSTPQLLQWSPAPFGSVEQDLGSAALFPLFTGLFGLSTLIMSRATTSHLPRQMVDDPGSRFRLSRTRKVRAVLGGSFAGAMVGWLPGMSGASATTIAKLLSGDREEGNPEESRELLVSMAGVNASTALFTLVALFVILRARSGAMVAVQALIAPEFQAWEPLAALPTALVLLLVAAMVASVLGMAYTLILARLFARWADRIPYSSVASGVIVALVVLIFLFTGLGGLTIAAVATTIGLLPPLVGVRRVHLMGALLLPVILFLLG